MSDRLPDWFEFLILAFASFRLFRIIGVDAVFEKQRDRLTRRDRFDDEPELYREGFDVWLHCPWCLGFWVALVMFGTWVRWPDPTMAVALPLALSAVVGLLAQNWDR